MHEHDSAIDKIDRAVWNGGKIISRQFDKFDIRKIAEPLGCKCEHVWRNVGTDPTATTLGQTFPNSANAAADFQNYVARIDPDIFQKEIARADAARLDRRFVLAAADVHLRTRKRFRERRPNAFII